jgi:hypothetical protein
VLFAYEEIDDPVLIGDCQGGWLATIYAALRVNTLTLAGPPLLAHVLEHSEPRSVSRPRVRPAPAPA